MLIAIGPHLNAHQDYTRFIPAETVQMAQQQGNTNGTAQFQVWDPLSSFPITTEDEVVVLDDLDPAGFPSTNLLTNGSMEGTYSGGIAPSWTGNNIVTGVTASKATIARFGAAAQQLTLANAASGTVTGIWQNVVLPLNEVSAPILTLPYTASVWYFISSSLSGVSNIAISIEWWTANRGSKISSSTQTLTGLSATGNWQRLSVSGTAPASAANATVTLYLTTNSATNSGTILWDGAQLEYNTYANYTSSAFTPSVQNPDLAYHGTTATTALSLYTSDTNSTTLTTAKQLYGTANESVVTNHNVLIGQSVGYGELWSQGNTTAKNLLSQNQSDVEVDTTGFTAVQTGVTLTRDTTDFWQGTASLKVVTDGSIQPQGAEVFLPSTTFTNGQTITVSCYVKGASGLTLRLFVHQQSPSIVIGTATPFTCDGTWQRVTCTATLPNPLVATNYGLRVDNNALAADTWWMDGLQIEVGGSATVWNDGGTCWLAQNAIGSPTGHGLLFDSTALESHYFPAGAWSQSVRLSLSTGTATADIITNWYKYNAGTYTPLGSTSLLAQNLTTAWTTYVLPSTVLDEISFVTGDKLYVDCWLNITTAGSAGAQTQWGDFSTTASTGGTGNVTGTPGYIASTVYEVADGWFASAVPSGMVLSADNATGVNEQVVDANNNVAFANIFTANQSNVETDLTGFNIDGAAGSGQGPITNGGVTATRDLTAFWQGTASLKAVTNGGGTFQYVNAQIDASNFVAGQTYTVSFYVLGTAGGGTLRYFVDSSGGAVSTVNTLTLTTTWTRYTTTVTLPNPITQTWFAWRVDTGSPAQAITFWVDGLQCEPGSTASTWQVGGTTQAAYTRGIAQDLVLFNANANYTLTIQYQVQLGLTSPACASVGLNFEDINGTTLSADTAIATGLPGENSFGTWKTLTLRFGPQTAHVPPAGTRRFKVFCGLQFNSTGAINGTAAFSNLVITPDPPSSNLAAAATNALGAGIYPTPYIDEAMVGLGQDAGNVWQDREVTNLYYRANRLFGGILKHAKMNYTKSSERWWEIDAADWSILLAEAIVVLVVRTSGQTLVANPLGLPDNQAIAQAFQYCHNNGYVQGVDWTTHVAHLTTLPAMAFNYQTLRDVMSAIADTTIAAYWVDPNKYLWYQQALSNSASFNVSISPDGVTSFPFEEWSLDFDSTQIMSTAIVQGQSELSAPQTQTFNGTGLMQTGQALTQGQTFTQLQIANPPNTISALSMLEINDGVNSMIMAVNTAASLPGTSVADPTTALTTSAPSSTGGSLVGGDSYTFGYTWLTSVADPTTAATTGAASTTGGHLAGGKSYTFAYSWGTSTGTESAVVTNKTVYSVPAGTNTNQITLTFPALPTNVSLVNVYCTASTDTSAILGLVGTTATTTLAITSATTSWNIARQPLTLSTINPGESKIVSTLTTYSVPAGTNTNQITLTTPAFPTHVSRMHIYCTASTDAAAVLGLVGSTQATNLAITSAPSSWSGSVQAPATNSTNGVMAQVQPLTSANTTTLTASAAWAASTNCWVMGYIVNQGLPIAQVDTVTYPTTASSLTIAIAATTQSGYNIYFDPQPAQVTFDATTYANGPAAGTGNVTITYRYDNPVLVRLLYPSLSNTYGRQVGFYQNIENIQSTTDAIHQASASIDQYGAAQPIGHLRLHFPPCPVSQPVYQGQFFKITHPPSLGTANAVAFQVQKVTTTVLGNGVYVRDIDAGYYRPDFATMMSQVSQDASHLQSDVNSSTILTDIIAVQDSWTMSDSITGVVGHVGTWGGPSTWGGVYAWA